MECLYGRMSYASWRLRQFRQLVNNSSSTITTSIRGPIPLQHNNHRIRTLSTSTDEPEPQPPQPAQQPSDTGSKETPAKPPREPRAKKSPPPSSLLPKSPLLTDPKPGYERLHKKKARSKPSKPDDLSTNPWAVALAAPIRQCSLTGQRMPTEFMTSWGLEEHPEGKTLFIHPSEILPPVPMSVADPNPSPSSSSSPDQPKKTQTSQTIRHLRFRMVNRLTLLNAVTETQRTSKKKFPAIVFTFPIRWRPPLGPMTESVMGSCVWRQDMPQFVTRMMRREVGQRLRRAAMQSNDSPKRQVWTSVLPVEEEAEDGAELIAEEALVEALAKMEPIARMETGAVLVLRRTAGAAPALPLSSFFHLPQTNSKVPVFDMTRLLAEEDLACAKFQGQAAVFFRPDDKPTVNAMLGLWKLAGLLRDDPHLDPHHDLQPE